ncbi:MAG: metal-sensing transcriptional repressor [Patescibacteria group bacterium]
MTGKHDNDFRTQALQRIKIAQGHLEKVRSMIEEDAYCPDVIHQSQAVQAALSKVDELVLHGHLHGCVIHDIHGTKNEKEKLVSEIVELFKKNK